MHSATTCPRSPRSGVAPIALILTFALLCSPVHSQKAPALPDELDAAGPAAKGEAGGADFDAAVVRRMPVPATAGELRFAFRPGKATALTLSLTWQDGNQTDIRFQPGPATLTQGSKAPGATPLSTVTKSLPDACLAIPEWKLRYFVRPNPEFYSEAELAKLRNRWTSIPGVSEHLFHLAIVLTPTGAELRLDGNYLGHAQGTGRLTAVSFPLAVDAEVQFLPTTPWSPWSTLDLTSLIRPGAMPHATLALAAAAVKARGVPLQLDATGLNADVGGVRDVSPPVDIDSSIYRYHERSAFEGITESLLLSVPAAPYTRAWVLCALEDDATKEPAFNVRLTRYRRGGIGNAMITTRVDLPGGDSTVPPPQLLNAGTVAYGPKEARKTVPLWLAEVSLNSSEIQDLLTADWAEGRLDLELLGLARNSASGVHVFAVTLERSPVAMEVRQLTHGSVFHNAETPGMTVALHPLTPGAVTLQWEVTDVWDKTVAHGTQNCNFAGSLTPVEIPVPLQQAEPGWYRVVFSLNEPQGQRLLAHTAAFAQLPPDTRRAGYESPFGCWWQQYLHSQMTDPAIIGPLLFKAGLRRTTVTCVSEAAMKPWKVTIDMIPWFPGYRPPGVARPTNHEWIKEYETQVRECRDKFPHSGMAMIFHESYDSSMAPEAWDGEPDPLMATSLIERAKLAGALLREKFPDLKIMVGNTGWSGALLSQLLRGGVPPAQMDALGMERLIGYFPKDTMPPERHEATWTLRQTALKYGCTATPSDCYESGGRSHGMSQGQIAKFVVRDSLVGLAWGYPYVGVGVISENVNSYCWGADALLRRTPLLYPQPQYVAIATMTRLLDSVKLLRRVPTGSHTVYALEFARGEERVYALWTPRGTCELQLKFPQAATVTVTGLYGQSRQAAAVNGELALTLSDEVTYLTAPVAAASITAGRRAFPLDTPPEPAVVLSPLTDPTAWQLTPAKGVECGPVPYRWLPWRTTGKGKLGAATDPEKGACLSVELVPEGKVTELLSECLALQATTPLPVPGKPTTLGVWVKGNSSWGRVMFEIIDAEGERFRGGGLISEPWGTTYLDFDGWCFIAMPLSDQSPARSRFHYNMANQWTNNGGNHVIDYPIRVTGLIVEMKRQMLDLAEMLPVAPVILLRDLVACGLPTDQAPVAAPAPAATVAPVPAPPAGAGTAAADDVANLLFRDDDLRGATVGQRPAAFAGDAILKEENGRRFLAFEHGAKGLFANAYYYGAQNWLDYEWSFSFRFPARDQIGLQCTLRTGVEPSPFNLQKLPPLGPEDACKGITVTYSAQGLALAIPGGTFELLPGGPWTAAGLQPLVAGQWYRTVVRAAGRALDVYLESGGRRVRVYRGPIPAGGGGVNLTSAAPLDVADLRVTQVTPTAEDWNHAGRLTPVATDTPVPGTGAWRIDGPFMLTQALALDPGRPCILSVYLRADQPDLAATLTVGSTTKRLPATKDWQRHSLLAVPQPVSKDDNRTTFAIKGTAAGPLWVAAPQIEYAPADPDARRAAAWTRTLEQDYELDDQAAHRGRNSLRALTVDGCLARQERELAAEESRPLVLGGWARAEGSVGSVKLKLELYRDKKYWTPNPNKSVTEEEPRETFLLELKPGARTWEPAALRITPRNSFKRYCLSVETERAGGTVWVDDLLLRPLGSARTAPDPDELGDKAAGHGGDETDDLALLDEPAGAKANLLENPGFETPDPAGMVTQRSNRPSAATPTPAKGNWFKPTTAPQER